MIGKEDEVKIGGNSKKGRKKGERVWIEYGKIRIDE